MSATLEQLQEAITDNLQQVGQQAQDWLLADETRALNPALDCDLAGVAWHLGLRLAKEQGRQAVAAEYATLSHGRISNAIHDMAGQNAPAQLLADAETLRQKLASYQQQANLPAASAAKGGCSDLLENLEAVVEEFTERPSLPLVSSIRDAINAIVAWQTLVRADAPTAAIRPSYQARVAQ